jgi:hypothetical protein
VQVLPLMLECGISTQQTVEPGCGADSHVCGGAKTVSPHFTAPSNAYVCGRDRGDLQSVQYDSGNNRTHRHRCDSDPERETPRATSADTSTPTGAGKLIARGPA